MPFFEMKTDLAFFEMCQELIGFYFYLGSCVWLQRFFHTGARDNGNKVSCPRKQQQERGCFHLIVVVRVCPTFLVSLNSVR